VKKFFEIIKKKWIADTTRVILLVALLVVAYLAINMLADKLNLPTLDFTEEKLYSVSDESKEKVKDIDQEVTIYFFGADENTAIIDFAKQYTAINEKIKVEVVDSMQRPDLLEKYGISNNSSAIVVQSPERSKIISAYDLSSYNYSTGETTDLTEEKVTNAIIETTSENKPKVYFLTGHGEMVENMTLAKEYLQNDVIDVADLDLLTTEFPADCNLLIIATPTKDFTGVETEKIINYINNGGNILWLNNPKTTELANVKNVLDIYGVSVGNGIVRETNSDRILPGTQNFILPSLSSHKVTENVSDGYVILFNSARLEFKNDEELEKLGVVAKPIMKSSESSYYRIDQSITSTTAKEEEEKGSFPIAQELTKKVGEDKESKLIIFANNLFVSDSQISMKSSTGTQSINAINFRSNSDILLNTVSYLVNREPAITIKKKTEYVTYTATQKEDLIIRSIIFVIPLIIIVIGIVIWQIRRRKR
jgi:ABC-type uncharacterized transport system